MWDQQRARYTFRYTMRIIPTYVGSTVPILDPCSYTFESFPRMWDQLHLFLGSSVRIRIIPTYVGSTHRVPSQSREDSNHSHVCGINTTALSRTPKNTESFPRMWDQRPPDEYPSSNTRIIPTYVGSTRLVVCLDALSPNHSHVCGINRAGRVLIINVGESFPRMWDQHVEKFRHLRHVRIIPTYVGSTRKALLLIIIQSNHSHVCGINAQ